LRGRLVYERHALGPRDRRVAIMPLAESSSPIAPLRSTALTPSSPSSRVEKRLDARLDKLDGRIHKCRVLWRTDDALGVRFTDNDKPIVVSTVREATG
jgi:hypothetical protein